MMEWFDFAVYGYLATTIGSLFFPATDPLAATLAAFAVFAVGFFARPIGGFLLGHVADKVGRRSSLSWAIVLMAFSTLSLGLLPTYAQIGALAPVLLVVARMAQGLSVGGELGVSSSFMVEYAPDLRRGYYGSWGAASGTAGLLLGSVMATLLSSVLSEEALSSWGWRIPFLLGALVGVVGWYIRHRMDDTPLFREIERTEEVESAPIVEVFRNHKKDALTAVGFTVGYTVVYWMFLSYVPTFVSQVTGLPLSLALLSNSLGLLLAVSTTPALGALSDQVGRKPLLISAMVGFALLTYPAFFLISTGDFFVILAVQLFFGFLVALFDAPTPATLVELFSTKVRASAFCTSYNLTVAAFGGTAPYIATFLVARTGNNTAPAFYVIAAAVVTTLVTVGAIRETHNRPLR
jgi:MHS family proline/betaine transporter-like MFS transporter